MSTNVIKKRKTLRFEIEQLKLLLFEKDVLSIINLYERAGFDEWLVKQQHINKEYLNMFTFEENGTICNRFDTMKLFNFRSIHDIIYTTGSIWEIYHYSFTSIPILFNETTNKTGVKINPKKYF